MCRVCLFLQRGIGGVLIGVCGDRRHRRFFPIWLLRGGRGLIDGRSPTVTIGENSLGMAEERSILVREECHEVVKELKS